MTNKFTKNNKGYVTKSQVKSMMSAQLEHKMISLTYTANPSPTAGVVTYVSAIAQDDTISGRTGLVIRPTLIDFRVSGFSNATTQVRLLLVQDRLGVGVLPAVTEILSTADYDSPYSIISMANNRFKILFDRVVKTSTAGELSYHVQAEIPMKGSINYVGTSALQASGGANAIYLLNISSGVTTTVEFKGILHYTDG